VLVAERWRDTKAAVEQYPVMVGQPPEFVKAVVDSLLGQLRGHGMGRHSADEVEHIGMTDLKALSDFVGDKPYLLGTEPTAYDATVYSFVAHTIQPDYDSRMKKFIKTLSNLTRYWERLTSTLYKA
jgi:glutathione S-transferase